MEAIARQMKAGSQNDSLVDVPSHAVADSVGALVGAAAAGAAVGTVAGPIGTVVGAVAGAIAGGLGADALVNSIDEVREDAHWRENFRGRPYVRPDAQFDDFAPAYRIAATSFSRYPDRDFDDVAAELSLDWNSARGGSTLQWAEARPAARDAWDRLALRRKAPGA